MKTKNKSLFLLKIGILFTLLMTLFMCRDVKAEDDNEIITITTSTTNVLLEDGKTYKFEFTKKIVSPTEPTATVEISNIPFYVSQDNFSIKNTRTGDAKCNHNSWKFITEDLAGYKTFKCNYCGLEYSPLMDGYTLSRTCWGVIGGVYETTAAATVVANYEKLNGQSLTINISSDNAFTWNIAIDKPAPRISSNLTVVNISLNILNFKGTFTDKIRILALN